MQFKKYPSITNSYDKRYLAKLKEYGLDKETYCVTEKVHGANFAIYYGGNEFRIASRNRFLADDANFFGCQKLLPELKEKIAYLYKGSSEINQIVIYGELCGGTYNHPDVKKVANVKKVQGHIWYHPDNIFYVFDIKIDGKYIKEDEFWIVCKSVNFLFAESLFTGSLEECLAYNNTYQTTIPAKFSLPKIENNICEGNVIKPITPLFFPNGERVMLKNKNEKFAETKKIKDPAKKVELSPCAKVLLIYLIAHVTQNRLDNVISKLGDVTIKDFSLVMKEFSHDIIKNFMQTAENDMQFLDEAEQKILRKTMNKYASGLVREYFTKKEK